MTPRTPSSSSTCLGRRLEEVVPDDVAREQPVGLLRRARAPRPSAFVFEPIVFWNAAREAVDAALAQRERLDQVHVLAPELPGRREALRRRDVLLLLRRRCC